MDKMTEVLDKILPKFLEELEKHCITYKAIGSGSGESPKWIQFHGMDYDYDDNVILFRSSQRAIGFSIDLTEMLTTEEIKYFYFMPFNKKYDYFKNKKYEYIAENHPTITEGGTR
jgi:hypothetical protein